MNHFYKRDHSKVTKDISISDILKRFQYGIDISSNFKDTIPTQHYWK